MLTWTVAFRTGGTENCEWKKTVSFLLESDALDAKEAIEKGGRKAFLADTGQLAEVGLPVGWDAEWEPFGQFFSRKTREAREFKKLADTGQLEPWGTLK